MQPAPAAWHACWLRASVSYTVRSTASQASPPVQLEGEVLDSRYAGYGKLSSHNVPRGLKSSSSSLLASGSQKPELKPMA